MSQDASPKDNLAQVLNRINTLTKHQESSDIPVLTEVFDGEPTLFAEASEIPVLNEIADLEMLAPPMLNADALLAEMMPVIQAAVRSAIKAELAGIESTLASKLEKELLEVLKQRLGAAQ